ncbi:MAG: hypothetical protein AAGB11_16380 [Pseudomonadota bacterium]
MRTPPGTSVVLTLVTASGILVGCVGGNLGRDPFVGNWNCGEQSIELTSTTITTEDGVEKIAWIETDTNADFGLFTTRGARYSIFDQTRNSLTFFSHASGTPLSCRRAR